MQKNYCFDHPWSVNELERKEKVNKVDKSKWKNLGWSKYLCRIDLKV